MSSIINLKFIPYRITIYVSLYSFSFYFGIFSCLPVFNANITSDVFDFDHANFPVMKADLQSINWIKYLNVYTGADAMWCAFSGLLNNIICRHCPRRCFSPPVKRALPANIIKLMKAKHCAWCYFKSTYTDIAKHSFKIISDMKRKAIRSFYRN